MSVKKEKAYIIKAYTINDADRVIVFLTEKGKKKSAVSKNAMRLKSRFAGKLEPYNFCVLEYFEKKEDSGELCKLNSVEVLDSCFKSIGGKMEKFTAFSLISEILDSFVYGNDGEEKIFRLTEHCLGYLQERDVNISATLAYYIFWLLKLSGVLPEFEKCSVCNLGLADEQTVWFNGKHFFCNTHKNGEFSLDGYLVKVMEQIKTKKVYQVAKVSADFKSLFLFLISILEGVSNKKYKSFELLKTLL
jgi:DNA repair protein RecO (recombination protein O)